MSVCVCVPALPPRVGGGESFAELLIVGLSRAGEEVHLLTTEPVEERIKEAVASAGGSTTFVEEAPPAGAIGWEHGAFGRAQALFRLIDQHRPGIVHALSHDAALSAAVALASSGETRPRVVGSFSETSTEEDPFGKARSRFVYALGVLDGLLAESHYYAQLATSYGYAKERIRIGSAVDAEAFSAGSRSEGRRLFTVPDDAFLVVCPSRFKERKRQLDLVEALGQIGGDKAPVRAILAGSIHSASQDYLDSVRSAVRSSGLESCVEIAMDVPRATMPHLIAAADLVVQPSSYEGLGRSALEAMAAGVCTVLTHTTGFQEIAEHGVTSYMYPPGRANELARAILTLMDNPRLRGSIAANARRQVLERYGVEALVRTALALYGEVETTCAAGPAGASSKGAT